MSSTPGSNEAGQSNLYLDLRLKVDSLIEGLEEGRNVTLEDLTKVKEAIDVADMIRLPDAGDVPKGEARSLGGHMLLQTDDPSAILYRREDAAKSRYQTQCLYLGPGSVVYGTSRIADEWYNRSNIEAWERECLLLPEVETARDGLHGGAKSWGHEWESHTAVNDFRNPLNMFLLQLRLDQAPSSHEWEFIFLENTLNDDQRKLASKLKDNPASIDECSRHVYQIFIGQVLHEFWLYLMLGTPRSVPVDPIFDSKPLFRVRDIAEQLGWLEDVKRRVQEPGSLLRHWHPLNRYVSELTATARSNASNGSVFDQDFLLRNSRLQLLFTLLWPDKDVKKSMLENHFYSEGLSYDDAREPLKQTYNLALTHFKSGGWNQMEENVRDFCRNHMEVSTDTKDLRRNLVKLKQRLFEKYRPQRLVQLVQDTERESNRLKSELETSKKKAEDWQGVVYTIAYRGLVEHLSHVEPGPNTTDKWASFVARVVRKAKSGGTHPLHMLLKDVDNGGDIPKRQQARGRRDALSNLFKTTSGNIHGFSATPDVYEVPMSMRLIDSNAYAVVTALKPTLFGSDKEVKWNDERLKYV